jgi:exopolysaccharide biosynthesis polyprenyl glycosylphosphotransferase
LDGILVYAAGLSSHYFLASDEGGALLNFCLVAAVVSACAMYVCEALAEGGRSDGPGRGFFLGAAALCSTIFGLQYVTALLHGGMSPDPIDHPSRIWFGVWCVSAILAMLAVRRVIGVAPLGRIARRPVAVVGPDHATGEIVQLLSRSRSRRADVVGSFRIDGTDEASGLGRSGLEALLDLGKSRRIDRILLVAPGLSETEVSSAVQRLQALSAEILLCPSAAALAGSVASSDLDRLPMRLLKRRPYGRSGEIAKRMEDLIVGTAMLIAFAPLMAIIALLIKWDTPGPILFKQRRLGLNNRIIEVLKFRSMHCDFLDYDCRHQTRRLDPRVTRVGRFLRRSSLDELPQLINVLRGDMSLVGPRPHAVNMHTNGRRCEQILTDYAQRHRVKPGITGWAQVNGYRGAVETDDALRQRFIHDMAYIDNWSLLFDLKILVRTVFHVSSSKNAF